MASATRTIRVRFDGSAKGLIKAAAEAGIAVEGFEKQVKKSTSPAVAKSVGGGLIEGLTDALGSIPSVLKGAAITAAVGIGVVMAPALAGVLIGGILAAVGGGVLAAGIIGAAKSPKVVKAWSTFVRQATVVFQRFSKPFIAPLARAATFFKQALARSEPTIRRIGETMAPFVEQLASGAALFVEKLLPGILTATVAAQPFIALLSDHLPLIAASISGFFAAISAGSGSAEIFFDRFLKWVEGILPKLGGFLTWLSDLGIKMETFINGPQFAGLKGALTSLKDNTLSGLKEGLDKVKKSIDDNGYAWTALKNDIVNALKEISPAVKTLVNDSLGALAKLIDAFAKLYVIIHAVLGDYNRLPGNLSNASTHVTKGDIPGRASGGPVMAGRSYLVGEEGKPEILTMGAQSGYMTPLDKVSRSASAAPSVEVHVHFDDPALRDLVRVEVREVNRQTKRAVLAGAGAR